MAQPTPQPPTTLQEKADANIGDTNLPLIFTIGACSALLLLVIVVGLQAWFYNWQSELHQERIDRRRHPKLAEALADEQIRLGSYEWVDREGGVARIPIDVAIDLYAERAARQDEADEAAE
jgi:hypothetical protein